jgi:hypothetical protein
MKYAAVALLLAISSPALAAEYYVAKDPATQLCKAIKEKPDGTKLVMIGKEAYPTKEAAKAAVVAAKQSGECKKVKPPSGKPPSGGQ